MERIEDLRINPYLERGTLRLDLAHPESKLMDERVRQVGGQIACLWVLLKSSHRHISITRMLGRIVVGAARTSASPRTLSAFRPPLGAGVMVSPSACGVDGGV